MPPRKNLAGGFRQTTDCHHEPFGLRVLFSAAMTISDPLYGKQRTIEIGYIYRHLVLHSL